MTRARGVSPCVALARADSFLMMTALLLYLVHVGGLSLTVHAASATLPPHPMRSTAGAPGLYCQYAHSLHCTSHLLPEL